MSGTYVTFGLSKIWDGPCDTVDPNQPTKTVKAPKGDVERARKKLPMPPLGRQWVPIRESRL